LTQKCKQSVNSKRKKARSVGVGKVTGNTGQIIKAKQKKLKKKSK
jgi:hypothetical protein